MKKIFLTLALVATSFVCANAQESVNSDNVYRFVAPITVECMEFNTSAMRDSAVNVEAYIAALNALQKQLNLEKESINAAMKSLKSEKSFYDGEVELAKERRKQLESTQKNLISDIKTYDSHLKTIKKQYELVKKMDDVSCDAIKDQTKRLAELENRYEEERANMQKLLDKINRSAEDEINASFARVTDFLREITDKETKLKNLQAQNKTNIDIVKQALKAATAK